MNTITTKPFALTPEQYFKIWWRFSRTKILIILGLYGLLSFIFWLSDDMYFAFGFFIAVPTLAGIFFLRAWFVTHSKKNKNIFKEAYYVFNEQDMEIHVADGGYSKTPLGNILKIVKTKEYYLLYLSGLTFRYLPKSAFAKLEDHTQFEELCIKQGVLKS